LETRKIWTSTELNGYIDFPHGKTVFEIERHTCCIKSGKCHEEVAYGITSVEDTAERILDLNRRHWEIENKLHWVRDVTFDEDRCQIRTGKGARVMASIRNLVINLIRLFNFRYIPQGLRYFATHLEDVLELLGV
jgi:predicted transposase YbfD/YdcC